MYTYHALINALSAHITPVNLNTILYTHVEHSPTKTIYTKYMETCTHAHMHVRTHTQTHTHTHAQTTMNSDMYDTDLSLVIASQLKIVLLEAKMLQIHFLHSVSRKLEKSVIYIIICV